MSCESVFEGQEYNGLSLKDCFVKGFGEEVFHMSRDYSNSCGRLTKWKNHVIFNLRCKKLDLVPKSLRMSCPIRMKRGQEIARHASREFVKERLRVAERKKKDIQDEIRWSEIGLKRRLGEDVF